MSLADIVIIAAVAAIFVFCVYKMVHSTMEGECVDCSSSGSCNAKSNGGHCQNSEELLAKASEAAKNYENKKLSASK